MVEEERKCVACRASHEAAAWYERRTEDGRREHLCGVEYFKLADKAGWVQVYPGED